MPVLTFKLHEHYTYPHDLAYLANRATEAVHEATRVPREKIQIFFETGPAFDLHVQLIQEDPESSVEEDVKRALHAAEFGDVRVTTYPPEHTAKGGKLRTPKERTR